MLYVTTMDTKDAYTAHRALMEKFSPDGGKYLPFSLPKWEQEDLMTLKEKNFCQTVAEILNVFFSCRLNSWDVEFSIGRKPMNFCQIGQKIGVAELWHNLEGQFGYLEKSLYRKMTNTDASVTDWARIAIRIAVLFGVYGEMLRNGLEGSFDVSVLIGDFTAPISAWYARRMGLPVQTILCTSTDNSAVWDFIHRGSFNPIGTDVCLQQGLERLIMEVFSVSYVQSFRKSCQNNRIFSLTEEELPLLNQGFFCTVAGENRARNTINSVYRTSNYILDPRGALSFGSVQDYRAKTGESKFTLLLSCETPLHFQKEIAAATGLKDAEIRTIINS